MLVFFLYIEVRDEGGDVLRSGDDALKRLRGRQLQDRDLLVEEVRDPLLEELLTIIHKPSLMDFLLLNCRL
jgi:membrane-bound ClpP family serine protease